MKKIILAVVIGIFLISFAIAWPYGFSYRRAVIVSNTAGDQTDFQVPVDLTEVDLNLTGLVGSWHFDEADPKSSCRDIKTWNPDATDGVYEISPQGIPFDVYCDMTTDGGGWMLLDNFVSSNAGDYDPYGAAIGGSSISGATDLSDAGYDVYLTNYDHSSYTITDGYLQMFYSGAPIGYIDKELPKYADEVYVKWGNWYGGTSTLRIGGSVVQTLSANANASTYQGSYSPGDHINFSESGIFWAGEVWVRKNQTKVKDSSGMDNNGVIYGAGRATGVENYGLDFDGTDDYIEVNDSNSLDLNSKFLLVLLYLGWIGRFSISPSRMTLPGEVVSRETKMR